MKIWAKLFIGSVWALCACSETEHAGVLSETESGKTVAGTVLTQRGTPSAKTAVYAVDAHHIATKDSVLAFAVSDENGSYHLHVENGDYILLFETEDSSQMARTFFSTKQEKISNDTIFTEAVSISDVAKISFDISSLSLNAFDTICVEGTFLCAQISAADMESGISPLKNLPESLYESISIFRNGKKETVPVHWNFKSGTAYVANASASIASKTVLSRTLPDSLQSKLPFEIDSVPFPVWLPGNEESPLIFDHRGFALPIQKVHSSADSSLYAAIFPRLDFSKSTLQTLYRMPVDNGIPFQGPIRFALHWDSLDANGILAQAKEFSGGVSPDTVSGIPLFSKGNMALSFWLKLEKGAFGNDTDIVIFSAMRDSVGFTIRQTPLNQHQSVGIQLFVEADTTVISDTTIYGSAKILDGKWHQLAMLIRGQHISVLLDGNVLHDTDFELSDGFGNLETFILGDSRLNGILDEFKLYDGTQDTLFLKAVYELERPDQIPFIGF